MFFGPARRVSCFTRNTVQGYKSEDSAVALRFQATEASWVAAGEQEGFRLIFSGPRR
jgi:hypothetical protein